MVRHRQQMVRYLKHLVRGKNHNRCEERQHLVRLPLSPADPEKQREVRVVSRGYKKKQQIVRRFIWGFSPLKTTFSASFAMVLGL